MTIATVCAAFKTILDNLSVTTTDGTVLTVNAYDPPPEKLDSAQFPALYVFDTDAAYEYQDADNVLVTRTYEIHCAVMAESSANLAIRAKHTRPLIDAVRAKLLSYPNMGTAGVQNQTPQSDGGTVVLPEYGGLYVGFVITTDVTELESRTYAAGE